MRELELFVVWTILLSCFSCGGGNVVSARCRSRCLSTHFTSSTIHRNSSQSMLEACERHLACKSCIYPCNISFRNLESCKGKCQEAELVQDVCSESCTFVKTTRHQRIGTCPPIEGDKKWIETACVMACTVDTECNADKKCCDNGCGRTCQSPDVNRRNYPAKVARDMTTVFENLDGHSATVRWRYSRPISRGEVILFVVLALNLTMKEDSKGREDWFEVGMTEELELSVPLLLGRRYKFKVASVNHNGSIGFSRPTVEFQLLRTPDRPAAPHSITEGQWWLTQDDSTQTQRVDMEVNWEPPKYSDLPIWRYRIFYSERRQVMPEIVSIPEHRCDSSGSETSCILRGLLPRMKYFVQVMAIARYGTTRLSSDRASVYLYTPELPIHDTTGEIPNTPFVSPRPPGPDGEEDSQLPGPPRDLTAGEPYWDNDTLKVRLQWRRPRNYEEAVNRFTIHWEPTVCSSGTGYEGEGSVSGSINNDIHRPYRQKAATTHDTTFELYDLSFDCTYEVWVRPVYERFWGPNHATTQILTPPCTEVQAIGLKPVCPTPVPDIPSAPQNFTFSYSISDRISAHFRWAPPAHSMHPLTGYRIYWAQVKPRLDMTLTGIPTIERDEFQYTHLKEVQHSYTISDLRAGSRYVVKIQALSSIGGGAIFAVDIETPNVASNPNSGLPSYRPPVSSLPPDADSPSNDTVHNHAAERLVAPTLYLYLFVILYTYYIIQR